MGFSLRNWLEEATAQIRPGDGKTAATVRAARTTSAPAARTTRTPTPSAVPYNETISVGSNQPVNPSISVPKFNFTPTMPTARRIERPNQSFGNKLRDVLDANTEADQYRRQQGNDRAIAEGRPQEVKDVKLTDPGNLIGNTVGAIPRMMNTVATQVPQVFYTAQDNLAGREYSAAIASGDKVRIENARRRVEDTRRNVEAANSMFNTGHGGLFNVGTLYGQKDAEEGGLHGVKNITAGTGEGMVDVATLGLGGITSKQIAKQGFKTAVKQGGKTVAADVALNAAGGAANAIRNDASAGDILKTSLLSGAAGTVGDIGIPYVGAKMRTNVPKIVEYARARKNVAAIPEGEVVTPTVTPDARSSVLYRGEAPASTPKPPTSTKVLPQEIVDVQNEAIRLAKKGDIEQAQMYADTLPKQHQAAVNQAIEAAQVPKPRVSNVHSERVVQVYADQLRSMESGLRGGDKIPTADGGYVRTSEHSDFYRKFYAENGRAPAMADWQAEARRQLDTGRADSFAQKAYEETQNPEMVSLFDAAESGSMGKQPVGEVFDVPSQSSSYSGGRERSAAPYATKPNSGNLSERDYVIMNDKPAAASLPAKVEQAGLEDIKISTKQEKLPVGERIKKFFDDAQSAAVDRYHPIEQFMKDKKVANSQNPTLLLKRYSGGMGIASQRIDDELKPIIQQTSDFDGLRKFLVAERMTELNDRGIGKSGELALRQLEESGADVGTFQKIANQLYDYQRKNLDMLHEVGALSDEQYDNITRSNQKYVPFQRVMDDLEQGGFIPKANDINVKTNGIKRIKGSDREIVDPLESIIKNTYDVQKTVEKQRVLNALRDLGIASGEMQKIDPQVVPVATINKKAEVDARLINDIVDFARERGLKTFQTEGNISRGTLAYYQDASKSVTRHFGTSAKTTVHEVGHFLDHKYGLKQQFFARGDSKAIGQELIQHMKDIGQSGARTGNPSERFAHAFEWYLTHRDLAHKDIPLFSKRMDEIIAGNSELQPLQNIRPYNKSSVESTTETVFGKSQFEPKEPHITVLEDGKPVYYQTDKAIADAMKGIDEEQLNMAIRMMSLPAKTLRAGATSLNVGFALPNIIRDQLSAAVNNKYGGIPIYDFISGLSSVIKQDDMYKRWMLSGADQASFFAQDRQMLQRSVKDVTGGKMARVGNLVKNPLELLRAMGEFSEKGSRVGVYKRAIKGASKEGLTGADLELAAMKESREATIDFSRRGSKMKAYNAITPFLNARLQGSLKLMQSIKSRPLQTLAIGAAYAGTPAAILYAHNSQYPEYDEVPTYIKQNYFVIMTGNPKMPFVKIPKGEIGMMFGNPVENFLDAVRHKEGAGFAKTATNILSNFSPVSDIGGAVPTAFSIPMQVMTNYDTFRKRNIVSPYKKDLPAELQTNARTSETAKKLGETFHVSPANIDFVAQGLTGGVGKQVTQASDALLFGKKTDLPNAPVVDRFLSDQNDLSQSAQDIYDQTEKLKAQRALENYKIKDALANGDTSVLEGLSGSRKSSLQRSVKDDAIEKNLTPTQKALYNATNEQLDMLEASNPKFSQDIQYIRAIKGSGSSTAGQVKVNSSISAKSKTMLSQYNALDSTGRKKLLSSANDAQYMYDLAKYENDKASGTLTKAQDITAQFALKKSAVGSNFSPEVREIYSLSKAKIKALVANDPNGAALYQELQAYGAALAAAGIETNKLGSGTASRSRSSSGGRKTSATKKRSTSSFKMFGFADPIKTTKSLRSILQDAKVTKKGKKK